MDFLVLEVVEGLRWSWNTWPVSKSEATALIIPLSIMCTPLMQANLPAELFPTYSTVEYAPGKKIMCPKANNGSNINYNSSLPTRYQNYHNFLSHQTKSCIGSNYQNKTHEPYKNKEGKKSRKQNHTLKACDSPRIILQKMKTSCNFSFCVSRNRPATSLSTYHAIDFPDRKRRKKKKYKANPKPANAETNYDLD
ncbi:hypothetical protein K1719_040047 [Acacia pycnantha]|nr:hypothetical protein K1719_040047 [Acacia pycnantha]